MSSLKTSLCLIFLFIAASAFAQDTDSLKKELKHARSPKQRLQLTYIIGSKYALDDTKNDSTLLYLNSGLKLATEEHSDSFIMQCNGRIAVVMSIIGDVKASDAYNEKAIAIARSHNYKKDEIGFLLNRWYIFDNLNKTGGNGKLLSDILTMCIAIKDKEHEATVYQQMANEQRKQGKNDLAIALLNKGMRINDSLKNYKNLSDDYSVIINIWGSQGNFKEALKYSLIRDSIDNLGNDIELREANKAGLAMAYSSVGDLDKAIAIYYKALQYAAKRPTRLVYIYPQLGQALAMAHRYKEALSCFYQCEEINNNIVHSEYVQIGNAYYLANFFYDTHKLDSALYYAKRCLALTDKGPGQPDRDNYSIMATIADIYAEQGDLKNAMLYSKKYEVAQDTLYAQARLETQAEQEAKFKLDENRRQVELLARDKELSKVKERAGVALLLLGVAIIVIIIIAYRRAMKKNAIIDRQVVQLETAAAMKTKFLANISHELRTPTTLLTGMLEMIKNKTQNNEPVDPAKLLVAFNNSRKLQYMIEELLDLSRTENKTMEVHSNTKELNPLLKRMVFAFETFIQKEQLSLQYNDEATRDTFLNVDEDMFEKIINNLVYNAIKFNKKDGAISVRTSLVANDTTLVIQVADTGSGILPEDLPHIFERFYQGTTSNKAKSAGVGIGLSLVKELVTLMNGTIEVSSKQGEGAVFKLQFPVIAKEKQVVTEREELPEMPVEVWAPLHGKYTVLIVEDNAEMRYYLREVLGDKIQIAEATHGKEALAWMEQHMPDLIISDMMMPEMDGREFVAAIKQDDRYNKIPVITLTALADMDNHISMLGLGVDDYIVKPFNAEELQIRVNNLLQNFAIRRQVNGEPETPDEVIPDNAQVADLKEKIKQYVLDRLEDNDISVGDLAQELLLSERQLYRLTKSLTGYTPAQLIKEVRLQKAFELLISEKIYKVEDVANRVGFENPSYFSKQFFERFGKRPTDFL